LIETKKEIKPNGKGREIVLKQKAKRKRKREPQRPLKRCGIRSFMIFKLKFKLFNLIFVVTLHFFHVLGFLGKQFF